MTEPVVTRFAPSPTGFLHIGGARTALFNWLFARHYGGKMLLRIEDTDRERSTEAAIGAIIDGLAWLGLTSDEEPVFQFSRAARHREVAEQLLAAGRAYRCYASPEELTAMREAARREGRSKLYDGRWRDRDPAEAPAGVKPVIRLKAPMTGETAIEDRVQGRVVWQNADLDDLVLLRPLRFDTTGRTLLTSESTAAVVAASRAPVVRPDMSDLGDGVLAGIYGVVTCPYAVAARWRGRAESTLLGELSPDELDRAAARVVAASRAAGWRP